MGLSPSKRVETALRASPEFTAACDAAFARCRAEAAHAFPGVLPHQLPHAAELLHADLSASVPLVRRWASSPPSRARVDAALRRAIHGASEGAAEVEARGLDPDEFGDFAAELFAGAVLAGGAAAAARGAAVGAAAIAGAGAAARAGAGVVARAVGVYAAGVVVAVYVGLS